MATADGTISLSWTDATGETGYRIERSSSGTTGWTAIATTGSGVTSYSDSGLPENIRYYYRVTVTSAAGDSAPSLAANALTSLNSPGSVAATFVSGSRIDLTWTDRSAAESSYQIEQSLDGVTGWTSIGTAAANATGFSASGPFDGSSTYYFRVRASSYYSGNNSVYSAAASTTTPAFPKAPASVIVTATVDGTINLAWTDGTDETGYRIERSDNGSSGWTPDWHRGGRRHWVLRHGPAGEYAVLLPGDRHQRRRRLRPQRPGQRHHPAQHPGRLDRRVRVEVVGSTWRWNDHSAAESGYQIEQSADGWSGWSQIGTATANATSFSAPGPFRGSTICFFRVRASSYSGGGSAYSTSASAITPAFPSQPTDLDATATEGTINLAWADAADETGYRIERSDNGSSGWDQIGTVAADATGYTDTGLPEEARYYYRVIATNAAGASAPSASDSVRTPWHPPAALRRRSSQGAGST